MLKNLFVCLVLLNIGTSCGMEQLTPATQALIEKLIDQKIAAKMAPSVVGSVAKFAWKMGFTSVKTMFSLGGIAVVPSVAALLAYWQGCKNGQAIAQVQETQKVHSKDLTQIKSNVSELHEELPQLKEANRIIKEEIPGIKQQFAQFRSEVHQGFEKNNKELLDLQQKMDVLPEKMEGQHQTTRTDLKQYITSNLTQLRSSLSGAINNCFSVFEKNVEDKLEEQSKITNQNISRMTDELKKDVNDLKKANEAHHQEILKNNQNLLDEVQIHRRETKGEMLITHDLLQQGIFHVIGIQVLLGGLNKKVGDLNTKISDVEKSFPIFMPSSIRYASGMGTGLAGYATTGNKLHNHDRIVAVESNNTKLIGFSSSMD